MLRSATPAWVLAGIVSTLGATVAYGQIGLPPGGGSGDPAGPPSVPGSDPGGSGGAGGGSTPINAGVPGNGHNPNTGTAPPVTMDVPSVLSSARASIGLLGYMSDPMSPVPVNSMGQTSVQVNTGLQNIGVNADGTTIYGGWSEISLSSTVRAITLVITTDQAFGVMPFGGSPSQSAPRLFPDSEGFAIGQYNFGVSEAVEFNNAIELLFFDPANPTNGVFMEEFSSFGAPRTVNLTKLFNIDDDSSRWDTDGGVDRGDLGAGSVTTGSANTVRVRYVYTIPSPGLGAFAAVAFGLLGSRRRRSRG